MFDVAVIGGGLAGCNAAIALAQQNRRVLLLEATPYPHPKVCGEFLSPECVALFGESGFLPMLQDLKPTTIRTLRITAPGGSAWNSMLPSPALGVSRSALDAAFAHYAAEQGVEVHEGFRVTKIDGNMTSGFRLATRTVDGSTTFQAASVIAAYGKRSNLDGTLKRAFLHQPQPYIGLKRHFKGPPLLERIDLHVFRGGYCGMSEVEGGATNVCLLARQEVFQRAGNGRIEPFIEWMRGQNAELDRWLAQATPLYPDWLSIGQVPFVAKTLFEGDVLLAGDAAGMIAPLAGDGMAMALHSGKLAAALVDRSLAGKISVAELKQEYSRAWNGAFRGRLTLARGLQAVVLRPALLTPGLRLLNLLPMLGNFLVAQTRDLRLVER